MRLRSTVFEMMAFAHLIQQQRDDQIVPLNQEDLNYGKGQILMRMGKRLMKLANELEEDERALRNRS